MAWGRSRLSGWKSQFSQALIAVALFQNGGADFVEVFWRQCVGEDFFAFVVGRRDFHELLVVPLLGDGSTREAEAGVGGDDAVKFERVALRGNQRFASAVRAAHEGAVFGGLLVVLADECLGDGGHFAGCLIGKVEARLLVGAEIRGRRGVAAIHADHGIAAHQRRGSGGTAHGDVADRRGDEAVHATAPLEEEALVPVFRQAQLEFDAVMLAVGTGARADFSADNAMRRRFLCSGRAAGEGGHVVATDGAV